MNYSEILTWKIRWKKKKLDYQIKCQVDFVHSLGQKCDSVGWSELDLRSADAERVLEAIKECCRQNGLKAEGTYERVYDSSERHWYKLKCRDFSSTEVMYSDDDFEGKKKWNLPRIRAANIADGKPREDYWKGVFVPDRFRRFCLAEGLDSVRFCWVRDCGRYDAEQYFSMLPDKRIPRMVELYSGWMTRATRSLKGKMISELGGSLEKLKEVFSDLDINVETCYLEEDMPEEGIGYTCTRGLEGTRNLQILIREDLAERMLREGVLSRTSLKPVAVMKQPFPGSRIKKSAVRPFPDEEICHSRLLEYDNLIKRKRPVRKATDKMALQLLKRRREIMPEDFGKRMTPKRKQGITEEPYVRLVLYYGFADGFQVDETGEYGFLSYQRSLEETELFRQDMLREQLLNEDKDGIVIAGCGNGDRVILNKNGRVRRFDHETGTFSEDWPDVAEFICQAVDLT